MIWRENLHTVNSAAISSVMLLWLVSSSCIPFPFPVVLLVVESSLMALLILRCISFADLSVASTTLKISGTLDSVFDIMVLRSSGTPPGCNPGVALPLTPLTPLLLLLLTPLFLGCWCWFCWIFAKLLAASAVILVASIWLFISSAIRALKRSWSSLLIRDSNWLRVSFFWSFSWPFSGLQGGRATASTTAASLVALAVNA